VKKITFLKGIFTFVISFVFYFFIAIQPSKAQITYKTQCGESITIGQYFTRTCSCGSDCTYTCRGARCGGEWTEYKAENTGCGTKIYRRTCRGVPTGNDWCCGPTGCTVECEAWETCEECGSWQKSKSRTCSAIEGSQYGGGSLSGSYQCSVTLGGLCKPTCNCDGSCIDQPLSAEYSFRYYQNSIYPLDPWTPTTTLTMNPLNIYLPVKIDWDDVRGFKDGWSKGFEKKVVERCSENYTDGNRRCIVNYSTNLSDNLSECEILSDCKINARQTCLNKMIETPILTLEDFRKEYYKCLNTEEENYEYAKSNTSQGCTTHCPSTNQNQCFQEEEYIKSYVITIESQDKKGIFFNNATTTKYTEVLTRSEFVPPNSCFFLSDASYSFKVKACCNENGTDCGPESSQQYFTTNRAPELKYPHDADWAGERKTKNVPDPFNLILQWCNFENKNYYRGRTDPTTGIWKYLPLSFKFSLFYATTTDDIPKSKYICYPDFQRNGKCEKILKPVQKRFPKPEYDNKDRYITKDQSYTWKISACKDEAATECTEFSQEWMFATEKTVKLKPPSLTYPPYTPNKPYEQVGIPVVLTWNYSIGAHSYIVKVFEHGPLGAKTTVVSTSVAALNYPLDFPTVKPEKLYSWNVQPCWDLKGKQCENVTSDTWYFSTTGYPPDIYSPPPHSTTSIPITVKWTEVPGAQGYQIYLYDVTNATTVDLDLQSPFFTSTRVKDTTYILDYPFVTQNTKYQLSIYTVVRETGSLTPGVDLGYTSSSVTFITAKLLPPSNPLPKDGDTIGIKRGVPLKISFDPATGAKYYQYQIRYIETAPDETRADCLPDVKPFIDKIISQPQDFIELKCLGTYEWRAKSCFDSQCTKEHSSEWSSDWTPSTGWIFKTKPITTDLGALVPCGRYYDDPKTPWDETEVCKIHHIFLLLQIILDFMFFRVGLIILAILILVSGSLYLFSLYSPEAFGSYPANQVVKQIWKYAGIGYLIVFLAWFIVNLFMGIIGYNVLTFGRWWEIKF